MRLRRVSTFRQVLTRVLPPALLLMLLIAVAALWLVRHTLERDARANLHLQVGQMARLLQLRVDNIQGTLSSMAANEIMVQSLIDEDSRTQFLPTYFATLRFPQITPTLVVLTDYKGRVVGSTGGDPGFIERPWLSIVMQGNSFFRADPSGMVVAVPVYYYDLPEGVLLAIYTPEEMARVLSLPGPTALLRVTNAGGQVLQSQVEGTAGTTGWDTTLDEDDWILASHHLSGPLNLTLIVGDRADKVFATVNQLAMALAFIFLVALAALLSGLVYTASMVTRPLSRFTRQIRGIRHAGGNSRIEPEGPREFRYMAESINAMLARLELSVRQRAEAEEASRAKSEFLSAMSHELRTPLNAILGFAQLLEYDKGVPLHPIHLAHVKEILAAGRHLLALIDQVLDLSKIESGTMMVKAEHLLLNPILQQVSMLLKEIAGKHEVVVELQLNELMPPVVFADPLRLKQVLLNLVSNAIKYNQPQGRVEIAAWVQDDGFVRVSVKDTGQGIAADQLEQLCTSFDRLGRERSNIGGLGVGLRITEKLVALMYGRLGFESDPGVGSHFWIELPAGRADAAMPSQQDDRSVPGRGHGTGCTVLYVEDNLANLALMERILEGLPGVALVSAQNGEDGLVIATGYLPDLIFLDINLPGIDGYEVLAALRSQEATARIPVYGVSADAMPGEVARGRASGFTDYLTKPLDVMRIRQIVLAVAEGGG